MTANTLRSHRSRLAARPTIRTKANYTGQLAIVNYYSLDYASPIANAESNELNRTDDAAAKPFHVVIANGYRTFACASAHSGNNSCTAGLLNQLGSPGTCGVHPSYAGAGAARSDAPGSDHHRLSSFHGFVR